MKIRSVKYNNRKKAIEVETYRKAYIYPYAKLEVQPSTKNKIVELNVDKELGGQGFTYVLESGHEGTVHIDHVLEYNRDPKYLRDLLIYKLTIPYNHLTYIFWYH